jgi:hypothetical protein
MASNQNLASYKQQRKSRRYPLNQWMQVNLALINTLWVVYTQWKENLHNPSFSLLTLAGTSEHLDSCVLGNHKESSWVHEISSNNIDSGES